MGGAVAQIVALERPDLVRSLVLCASFAKLDPLGVRVLTNMRQALEWRGDWNDHARHSVQNFVGAAFFNGEPEQVARIEALIGGETRLPACYVRQNIACLEHDTLDRLPGLRCPTLVMAGAIEPRPRVGERRRTLPRLAGAHARREAPTRSTMSRRPSGAQADRPTNSPSTAGWDASATQLSGLTLPP